MADRFLGVQLKLIDPGAQRMLATQYMHRFLLWQTFSETLLAGVLADEFELAIMDFRESRVAPLPRRLLLARASDTDLRWFVHGRSRDASGHDALP